MIVITKKNIDLSLNMFFLPMSSLVNAGLRHIALLRLSGKELLDMEGVLELYPINGNISKH